MAHFVSRMAQKLSLLARGAKERSVFPRGGTLAAGVLSIAGMSKQTMIGKESGPGEAICPRCGVDALWSYVDEERTLVEVVCPDCGPFELPRAEFEVAESEIAAPEDRE